MNSDTLWFAVSIAVLSVLAARQVLKLLKRRRAHGWPNANGQVVSTALNLQKRGGYQSVWLVRVDYQYLTQGQPQSGFIERSFLLRGRADTWAERFSAGRELTVRVNPHNPADSVLLENEQR